MNDVIERPHQTPIEIALEIDENGMTTAKKLYAFLERDPRNYSRWLKTNILENEFATENEDYKVFVIDEENPLGGRPTQDYKLTAHFAKKLSQKGDGEKGEEVREYFTIVEEKTKELAIDRSKLSPQMQMFYNIADGQARVEIEQRKQAQQIAEIKENQKTIILALTTTKEEDFKHWINRCMSAIAESGKYQYNGTRSMCHQAVRKESYERLNQKRPCRLGQRVDAEKGRALRNGANKKSVDAINKLYIIEHDKDLKPAYELVVKEMMAQYCVKVD